MTDGAAVRARLDHPVVDGDGHLIELVPLVRDVLVELGGEALAAGLDRVLAGPARARALDGTDVRFSEARSSRRRRRRC